MAGVKLRTNTAMTLMLNAAPDMLSVNTVPSE